MENLAELLKKGHIVIEPMSKSNKKKECKKSLSKKKSKKKKEESESEDENSKEEIGYLKKFLKFLDAVDKRRKEKINFNFTQEEKNSILEDIGKIKTGSFEKTIYGKQSIDEYFEVKEYVDKIAKKLYDELSLVM